MNRTTILVIGQHVGRFNNDEWNVSTATNAEAAIEKLQQSNFDIVVITSDAATDTIKLEKIILFQQPDAVIIHNVADELIEAAITAAINKLPNNSNTAFSIVDDALKDAMLPINIQ